MCHHVEAVESFFLGGNIFVVRAAAAEWLTAKEKL